MLLTIFRVQLKGVVSRLFGPIYYFTWKWPLFLAKLTATIRDKANFWFYYESLFLAAQKWQIEITAATGQNKISDDMFTYTVRNFKSW